MAHYKMFNVSPRFPIVEKPGVSGPELELTDAFAPIGAGGNVFVGAREYDARRAGHALMPGLTQETQKARPDPTVLRVRST
jgi:hypothetical protein